MSELQDTKSDCREVEGAVSEPRDDGGKVAENVELVSARLDYAWKWFQHHATQRTTMFNYFLVVSGILVTAYVSLLKEGYWYLAVLLGVLGSVTSLGFSCLDRRNRELVRYGEDALRQLEVSVGFHDDAMQGILRRDAAEEAAQGWIRRRILKHGIWIRGIECYVGVLFLVLGLSVGNDRPAQSQPDDSARLIKILQEQILFGQKREDELLHRLARLEQQLDYRLKPSAAPAPGVPAQK